MNNYPDDIRSYDNDPRSPFAPELPEPSCDIEAELLTIMDADRPGFEVLELLDDCDPFAETLKDLLDKAPNSSLSELGIYARALILDAQDHIRKILEESQND